MNIKQLEHFFEKNCILHEKLIKTKKNKKKNQKVIKKIQIKHTSINKKIVIISFLLIFILLSAKNAMTEDKRKIE